MKKYIFLKHKPFLAWAIATLVYIVLVILIVVFAFNIYSSVISLVAGGERPVYDSDVAGIVYDDASYFATKDEAVAYADEVVREVSEEGFVLVKNDDVLPLDKGTKISVFGKNSVNLVYSGTGSAAGSGSSTAARTIFESLQEAGFEYNPVLKEFYEDNNKSGAPRSDDGFNMDGDNAVLSTLSTAETPYSKYTDDVKKSYSVYNDAAIIVYSRVGGEGNDLIDQREEGHYLQLDSNEKQLLQEVAKSFDKVIVIINSANAMELGFVEEENSAVDACLLIGRPGNNGIMALGSILNGSINPSGHTVDTYSSDFTSDPSWIDFSSTYKYDVAYNYAASAYFTKYSEGIYVGYRYYETRALQEGEDWYNENVVYPFGFGLSYSTFSWELIDDGGLTGATISGNDIYTIKINVTNQGPYAGKDVVEVYASVPYYEGEIEKSYKVLCGYAKTALIQPGDSDEVEIEIDPYNFASYDYDDSNNNGFIGYELDAGTYNLFVSTDSHNAKEGVEPITFKVAYGGITYAQDPVTGTTVSNRFDDADDYLGTVLSRQAWEDTFPQSAIMNSDGLVVMPQDVQDRLNDVDAGNKKVESGQYDTLPIMGADNGIDFSDLIGLDYCDDVTKVTIGDTEYTSSEAWDAFMDQLTFDEMLSLYNEGAFVTASIVRLGVAATIAGDGPNGWACFMDAMGTNFYNEALYCSETVTASTWNNELAQKIGEAIGEEALVGNGNGTPYSGWYAPGANIHRSPFGGRNGEYFSEDSFLSGMMAVYEIKGAQSRGVITYMKHFAVNEQENNRQALVTWIDEQTLREIYLKPFEMAVKLANTHGIMSSFNRLGTKWTGGYYTLLVEVLREEWGFKGCVISDYNTNTFMSVKQEIYAGGDLSLQSDKYLSTKHVSESNAQDVNVLRQAAKNVLYAVNNSNIMGVKILYYKMPVWKIVSISVLSVLGVVDISLGCLVIWRALKKKK